MSGRRLCVCTAANVDLAGEMSKISDQPFTIYECISRWHEEPPA